jgi:outer membrane receptor for ferrienterochelin and colicins
VGKGFKSPTIRQLYYNQLYQHSTYWYRSNPDLEAEESIGYSFSVEQGISDRFLCELTLFRNDLDNKVLRVDTDETYDDLPITTYENASEAHTQGVEFTLKAILTDRLTGNISYAYMGTEDEDTGNELAYVPENNVTVGLVYAYSPWGVTFSVDTQYAGKMFTNSTNTSWTEDYILVDGKLSKKFGKRFTVSVEGNNVFDSDYGQPTRDWLGATYLARLSMKF